MLSIASVLIVAFLALISIVLFKTKLVSFDEGVPLFSPSEISRASFVVLMDPAFIDNEAAFSEQRFITSQKEILFDLTGFDSAQVWKVKSLLEKEGFGLASITRHRLEREQLEHKHQQEIKRLLNDVALFYDYFKKHLANDQEMKDYFDEFNETVKNIAPTTDKIEAYRQIDELIQEFIDGCHYRDEIIKADIKTALFKETVLNNQDRLSLTELKTYLSDKISQRFKLKKLPLYLYNHYKELLNNYF